MNNVPIIKVNGIIYVKRIKFFSTVSESSYFKGLMLIILFLEVITTIIMSNYKAVNHFTTNEFKKLHIFFTMCFLIEFIFNFFAKPKKYFQKVRNTVDFIALILSLISIYYENAEPNIYSDNQTNYIQKNSEKNFGLEKVQLSNEKNRSTENETQNSNDSYYDRFYSWNNYRKQRARAGKSPIIQLLKFFRDKISGFFTFLCTPRNSPFNFLDVLQSIRIIRVFYLNKYLKTEFKSFMAVTSATFPILLIFTVFMTFFGFVGNYLYSKGTESLFGNIFISIFTVFGVSTKDGWVKNTKLINKGIIQMKELSDLKKLNKTTNKVEIENINTRKLNRYSQFIPKSTDYGIAKQRYDYFDSEIDQTQSENENKNENNQKVSSSTEKKNEQSNDLKIETAKREKIAEEETAQITNERSNQKEKISIDLEKNKETVTIKNIKQNKANENNNINLNENENINLNENNNAKMTFEELKQMQKTNEQKFKSKTIIHNSFEYTLKKKTRNSTYSVWFTVSVVTVLGTILSTFVVSRITDTFTSGTDNYKKKEKRKAIRKVVKLLQKYKDNLVQTSEIVDADARTNPELFLSDKQFHEMINILAYLKKSKDHLKEFIKDNKVNILNYKPEEYNYNYVLEYYNADYYEFEKEDDFKKEILKRRRLIEELEIMLQFYLEKAQNAFITEVNNKHKNMLVHLRDITRNFMRKQKERRKKSLEGISVGSSESFMSSTEIGYNNITLNKISSKKRSSAKSLNQIPKFNKNNKENNNEDTKDNNTNQNNENENNNELNDNKENNDNNNDNKENNNDNDNDNEENNDNDNDNENSFKDKMTTFNKGSLHKVEIDFNINNANEIAINESGTISNNNKSSEAENDVKIDINSDGFEDISVEDYSEAYDDSSDYSDEKSEPVIFNEFECFGPAINVTVNDVERLPPPPNTKKTVIFNPQFVRAMKIILKHLINDMERYIELQSALIARLSELSNET